MIDLNLFFALTSFYFVMYVTPGPNNAMVLTSGIKFGFSKTVPHVGDNYWSCFASNSCLSWFGKTISVIPGNSKCAKNSLCNISFVSRL